MRLVIERLQRLTHDEKERLTQNLRDLLRLSLYNADEKHPDLFVADLDHLITFTLTDYIGTGSEMWNLSDDWLFFI